jgi:uncharacterized protein (TIRG00374 family)
MNRALEPEDWRDATRRSPDRLRLVSLRLLVPLVSLAALVCWFGWRPLAQAIAHASAPALLAYLGLTAVIVCGYALRWRVIATALGVCPPFVRLLAARLAGDAVGSLVPSAKLAGEPLRIAMVRDAATPTAQSTAAVAMDRLLEVIGNIIAVGAYVAVLYAVRSRASAGHMPLALAATTAVVGVALAALLVRLRRGGRPFAALYGVRARTLAPKLATWMDGVRTVEHHLTTCIREHPRAVILGVLGSVIIETLTVAQYHTLLAAFGVHLGLPTLFLVLLGGGIANAVPVPAGLGALEVAQVAVVGAASGRPDIGFVVGAIIRLHSTLLLALGLAALALRSTSAAGLSLRVLRANA